MQRLTSLTFALAAVASASASLHHKRQSPCDDPNSSDCDQYFSTICSPVNATGALDLTAPCNAAFAIFSECTYGAAGLALVAGNDSSAGTGDVLPFSNATQRICACESQLFAELQGCNDCFKAHGAVEGAAGYVPAGYISSLSSSYCAAAATPTQDLADAMGAWLNSTAALGVSSSTPTSSGTFSDPIGNKTDVSYYFTPSVTGSAAYVVAQATETALASWSGGVTSTSIYTDSNGQIVATAATTGTATSGSAAAGSASGSASGTATSTKASGAASHEVVAVGGVLALAGFVALL